MKNLVNSLDPELTISIHNDSKISRDVKRRRVINKEETKLYRLVYTKRVIIDKDRTLPYGY